EKTKVLGRIRDFPITIEGKIIPINVEVLENGSPLLLGNDWMTKARASYNWETQELTLKWRKQSIVVPATCITQSCNQNISEETQEEEEKDQYETEEEYEEQSSEDYEEHEEELLSDEDIVEVSVYLSAPENTQSIQVGELS